MTKQTTNVVIGSLRVNIQNCRQIVDCLGLEGVIFKMSPVLGRPSIYVAYRNVAAVKIVVEEDG